MLEIDIRKITDDFDRQEMKLLELWDNLPPIYLTSDYEESRKYENLAGVINHIEKCKHLLRNPPIC